MKAIFAPSGDQRPHLSCAFEEFVRLRVGPFSMGTLNTSPRAMMTARSPFGLSAASSICLAAETRDGRIASASVQNIQLTRHFVHDLVLMVCARPAQVPLLAVRHLLGLLRRGVV